VTTSLSRSGDCFSANKLPRFYFSLIVTDAASADGRARDCVSQCRLQPYKPPSRALDRTLIEVLSIAI
jgi:hypothetical protein